MVVGELAAGHGDPAPSSGAVVIAVKSELVGPCGALVERSVAVALEQQVTGAARQRSISGITRRNCTLAAEKRLTQQLHGLRNLHVKVGSDMAPILTGEDVVSELRGREGGT